MSGSEAWLAAARGVIDAECEALAAARDELGEDFLAAVRMMLECKGKLVCTGVGKSGHIARKAAATFASTGAPAFFMHPAEGGHGDVGALAEGDLALALSYSGESAEVLALIPAIRRRGAKIAAITGRPGSSLAKEADVSLAVKVAREACPLNLAPTASTTAMLGMTDALAAALLTAREFSADDFARSHPAGMLGRRLLTRVSDVMRCDGEVPTVAPNASFADALVEMTGKRMGMVLVAEDGALKGIFTDGDLRRAVSSDADFSSASIDSLMTDAPRAVLPDMLAAEALDLMREARINHLAVVEGGRLIGALSFHDLLAHGLAQPSPPPAG